MSSPNVANSPLLTPQGTPLEKMATGIFQCTSANSSPVSTPSSPVIVPNNMDLSSSRAVSAFLSNVMKNVKAPAKHGGSESTGLLAKSVLHSHCPSSQQAPVSPLVKSSTGSIVPQSPALMSNDGRRVKDASSPVSGHGSPLTAQSHKVVTVSKLPSPEQLTSLLQQLQQNSSLSRLISTAANSVVSRQLFNGSNPARANPTSGTAADPSQTSLKTRQAETDGGI